MEFVGISIHCRHMVVIMWKSVYEEEGYLLKHCANNGLIIRKLQFPKHIEMNETCDSF